MKLSTFLSVADFAHAASNFLPNCVNGFVAGGTEDGQTLDANRRAFESVQFRPRGLMGVDKLDQGIELFGHHYPSPIGIAPLGVTTMCRHRCDDHLAAGAKRKYTVCGQWPVHHANRRAVPH